MSPNNAESYRLIMAHLRLVASKAHNYKTATQQEAVSAKQACARGWPRLLAQGYEKGTVDAVLDSESDK